MHICHRIICSLHYGYLRWFRALLEFYEPRLLQGLYL